MRPRSRGPHLPASARVSGCTTLTRGWGRREPARSRRQRRSRRQSRRRRCRRRRRPQPARGTGILRSLRSNHLRRRRLRLLTVLRPRRRWRPLPRQQMRVTCRPHPRRRRRRALCRPTARTCGPRLPQCRPGHPVCLRLRRPHRRRQDHQQPIPQPALAVWRMPQRRAPCPCHRHNSRHP
jgi:hypothetical protein